MDSFLPKDFSFGPYAQMCTLLFLFSPLPILLEAIRTKNNSKIPNLAYPSMAIMQLGWTMYGILIANPSIFRASAVSMIAQIIYATLGFVLKKQYFRIFILYAILLTLTMVYRQTPAPVLATLVCIVQLVSSSTNLELLLKSFSEGTGKYYNISSILMAMPSGLVWGLFGIEIMDISVMVPPFYDLFLTSLQLCCIVFLKEKKRDNKEQ